MTRNQFFKYVRREIKKKGGRVRFLNTHNVKLTNENTLCSGYWDEDNKLLVASKKQDHDTFFYLVMHEFCHFMQWLNKRPLWVYSYNNPIYKKTGLTFENILFGWIEGDNYSPKLVRYANNMTRDYELDCERLVVNMIDFLGLPVDKDKYCQKAGIYLYFYNLIPKVRQFYIPGKEVYNIPQITKLAPKDLNRKYAITPKHIQKLMIKHSVRKENLKQACKRLHINYKKAKTKNKYDFINGYPPYIDDEWDIKDML